MWFNVDLMWSDVIWQLSLVLKLTQLTDIQMRHCIDRTDSETNKPNKVSYETCQSDNADFNKET